MFGESFLSRVAGGRLVRNAVDAVSRQIAHNRVRALDRINVAQVQQKTLLNLVRLARNTRFGREHDFARIQSVEDYQARVPIRDYEAFWNSYWKDAYPSLAGITWPEFIPYYALSSGTTSGTTKYIPVSRAMLASNKKAAFTTLAFYQHQHPEARLFQGRFFFLGGSTDLRPQPDGSFAGDLSGIAAREVHPLMRPYSFPPLQLSLLTDWEQKVQRFAEQSLQLPITAVSGVPSWMLILFERLKRITGKHHIAEIWPHFRLLIHGGTKFDPYRELFRREIGSERVTFCEVYPCSEGFIATEDLRYQLLRIIPDHQLFFEFVPLQDLDRSHPPRHTLDRVEVGVQYAVVVTTCAGLWAYLIGDTVCFERRDPPLIRFTGRTKFFLSAFGEHLILEEVDAAITHAARACGVDVVDFHVGPVFPDDPAQPGYHQYFVEFRGPVPVDRARFASELDAELARRNEDYAAHRAGDVSMLAPRVKAVRPGGFAEWMKSRGKFGGQNKVPRMDNSGQLTSELESWLSSNGWLEGSDAAEEPGSPPRLRE